MYWITGIFGLALIVAPFALSYTNSPMAMWSSIVLSGYQVLFAPFQTK
jgi:hypothetical protein